MNDQEYEYRDLVATTWDLLRGDTSKWPDKFFYRDFITLNGESVLDVGCGTGRLLLDYMADGIDIDGVDNSPEMLTLCREKASRLGLNPTLFQQSMEDLNLPRRYRTILVPSSSFQLVMDIDSVRRTMKHFYNHLETGGVLIMPFMIIWQEGNPLETDWVLDAEQERPHDGAVIRRWSRARFDLKNQLEHTETRFEASLDSEIIASEYHDRSPATRWYTQSQSCDLYHAAGFTNLLLFSEFSHQPASDDDTIFSVVGTKL